MPNYLKKRTIKFYFNEILHLNQFYVEFNISRNIHCSSGTVTKSNFAQQIQEYIQKT